MKNFGGYILLLMERGENMRKNTLWKVTYICVTGLLLALVVYCGYRMINARLESEAAKEAYTSLARQIGAEAENEVMQDELEEAMKEAVAQHTYPPLQMDMDALQEMNGDFRGWLYFPAVDISYPIVQAEDNDYYLHRSFEGEKLSAGCIFMDCGASADWSDRNTFVFGHNMRDGSMFGNLKMIVQDPTVCQVNKYFYIYTEECVYTYEVFSCYKTDSSGDRYMTFTSDENYDLYTDWAMVHSVIESEADLTERPNIVSLSTCHGSAGTSRRLIVHGVLVLTEEYTAK